MASTNYSLFLISLSILFILGYTATAQNLTAFLSEARLPASRFHVSALYDGDDTIYLFGGYRSGSREVLKYSISTDSIQPAGTLPEPSYGGVSALHPNGNIFHIVGDTNTKIYQYFPTNQTFREVSSLPRVNRYMAHVKPEPDTVLLFGGYLDQQSFTQINLTSLTCESTRTGLPVPRPYPAAIWVEDQNAAYIFPSGTGANRKILKYRRSSNDFLQLATDFPLANAIVGAVWVGDYGFIVAKDWFSNRNNSILKFDPETEQVSHVPIGGDETWIENQRASIALVYVEKVNRVYIFGGNGVLSDRITYIDLGEHETPTTTTSVPFPTTTTERPTVPTERTTPPWSPWCPVDDQMEPPAQCPPHEEDPTFMPYPYDCRKYFQCSNGQAICMQCAAGTVWNQNLRVCDDETQYPCDIITTTPRSQRA